MYSLLRPLLFALDAETAHDLTLSLLRRAYFLPGSQTLMRACYARRTPHLPQRVMGLDFPNPVGLAAGLDKNARVLHPLMDMGFGWLELGTVTPKPQPGNPKKRMFRLTNQAAIINRMGFNSDGLAVFLANLTRQPRPGILGINIGKNRDTPVERALDDYLPALSAVYPQADYVAINISSPNTLGLRSLQDEAPLSALLDALKCEQAALTQHYGRYVPLALKIAPDLEDADIDRIARLVQAYRFDAVIATNTTLARPGVEASQPHGQEAGGLSGEPLGPLSTRVIRRLYASFQGQIAIIGVGGIGSTEDAWGKLVAGADLVQVYTSLIYQGPGLIPRIVRGLERKMHEYGADTLVEAVARARQTGGVKPSR